MRGRGPARREGIPGQAGVTLIEALITLLIMSIGLLGIAALQVVALQEGASSSRHSQAVWLSYDMADRMRANLVDTNPDPAVEVWIPGGATDPYDGIHVDASMAPGGPACGVGDNCLPDQMAAYDTDQWLLGLQGMPNGTGTVNFFPGMGGARGLYRVRVMWDEVRGRVGQNANPDAAQTGCPTAGAPAPPDPNQACVELWVQP